MTWAQENSTLLDLLATFGAVPAHEVNVLRRAADHPYSCTCDTCREFWRLVGPDDDTGQYGPFGPTLGPPGGPPHD